MNNKLNELMEDIMIAKSETGLNVVYIGIYLNDTLAGNPYGFTNNMGVLEFLQAFANAYYDEEDVMYEEDLNIIDINRLFVTNGFNIYATMDTIDKNTAAKGFPYGMFELGIQGNQVTSYKLVKLSRY